MLKSSLEQWRMFKAVVDHGGFAAAAEAVHKSQSTVHHAVHKLEELLGVALLTVKGRKATLTPTGELMLRRANYLLEEAIKLEALASNLGAGVETRLKIAVDEAFPQTLIYRTLESVSAQFPLLRIELMESVLSGANELVSTGKADLSISPQPMTEGFQEEICMVEFVAVAHPEHSLHHQEHTLTFEDLKSHRQIVIRDSAVSRSIDTGWLGSEQRWTVSHVRTSVDLIRQGFGFAWLPEPAVHDLLVTGELKPLPLQQGLIRHASFYLNFKDADKLGPAARTFIGELRYATQ